MLQLKLLVTKFSIEQQRQREEQQQQQQMDSLTQKLLEENERHIADVFQQQQEQQEQPQELRAQEPQQIFSQDEQQPKKEILTLDDLSNLVRSIREKIEADVLEAVDADTINYNLLLPPTAVVNCGK